MHDPTSDSSTTDPTGIRPISGDALIVVDVQNDFLPGGTLAVPHGEEVVDALNEYLAAFARRGLPIVATRDWHPPDHCSFRARGGPWPAHCVAGSAGAAFAPGLRLPDDTVVVDKASDPQREAYSGFDGTGLAARLRGLDVERVFVGGLATDYCVLNTVLGALDAGFRVLLLEDAVRAVDIEPGDGERAVERMCRAGAAVLHLDRLAA